MTAVLLFILNGCSSRTSMNEILETPIGVISTSWGGASYHGTGFFISLSDRDSIVYFVTAKHSFINLSLNCCKKVILLLAPEPVDSFDGEVSFQNIYHDDWSYENGFIIGSIDANKKHLFIDRKNEILDFIVVPVRLPRVLKDGNRYIRPKVRVIPVNRIERRSGIMYGTEVAMLGYPNQLGVISPLSGAPLSPMRPFIQYGQVIWEHPVEPYFAVNIESLPGNSGSPVFDSDYSSLLGMQTKVVISQDELPVQNRRRDDESKRDDSDGLYIKPLSAISIMFYAEDLFPVIEDAKEFMRNYHQSEKFRSAVKTERDVFNGPSSRRPLEP